MGFLSCSEQGREGSVVSVLDRFKPHLIETRVCLKCGRVYDAGYGKVRSACECGGTLCARIVLERL
jgi:hypothetical protein